MEHRADRTNLSGHRRSFGGFAELRTQQGISESFSGVMLGLFPCQAGCSLPFLAHQLERSVDQLGMLQVDCVG